MGTSGRGGGIERVADDGQMIYNILRDYKMLNCEVLVRDENGSFRSLLCIHGC